MVNKRHKLILLIWREERIPEEWKDAIITPIHKKGDKTRCNNYRGISLLVTAYKILTNVLLFRFNPYAESCIGDYQAGFRRNRSTTDQLFTLRQIFEKMWEYNLEVHNIFIDFSKAYDSIQRIPLWNALTELGIPHKLVKMAKICVTGSRARVRANGTLSNSFEVETGVKQGDGLSPVLFNLILEKVMRDVLKGEGGVELGGCVEALGYADDLNLIATSKDQVLATASHLEAAAKTVGLSINTEKTKYLHVSRAPSREDAGRYEAVTNFRYLGSILTSDNQTSEDVSSRIRAANVAYFQTRPLFRSRLLSWTTKIRLYKTLVRPVLLYGAEAWTLTSQDSRSIKTFENKMLRRIFGGRIEDGAWRIRTNEEIHRLYGSADILTELRGRRLQWLGHVERMGEDRTARRVWMAQPQGRRPPGRPRKRWSTQAEEDLRAVGLPVPGWRAIAQDRSTWRQIVHEAKSPPGLQAPN